jgi:hypothetical protein
MRKESKMKWKERRGNWRATSGDEQIDYVIILKKNGRYFIKAYLGGGAEHRLPFQDFASPEAAQAWVADYERERAEKNARYRNEKPIRF